MSDKPPMDIPPTLDLSPGGVARSGSEPGSERTSQVTDPGSPIGQTIHGIEVREEIGRGGMGEVYKAWDPALQRWVALKVLPVGAGSEEALERFLREARAASIVKHDHVAQVFFAGTWQERPYYAMEWVDGPSLAEVRQKEGRLSGQRTLEWMTEAAEGLQAAQKAGVIHRDVKPSNLVVDSKGELKVVDFGLARRMGMESTLTRVDSVVGTPHYMSPEQATGRPLDHRSDIYSLGATFYELLTGRPPFEGDTPVEVASQHVLVEPMPVGERNPHVPEWLSRVIGRMLAKEPSDRYPSYDQLLSDLRSLRSATVPRIVLPASSRNSDASDASGASGASRSSWKGWVAVLVIGVVVGVWLGKGEQVAIEEGSVTGVESVPSAAPPRSATEASAPPPPMTQSAPQDVSPFGVSMEPSIDAENVPSGADSFGSAHPQAPDPSVWPQPQPSQGGRGSVADPGGMTESTLRALAQDVEAYRRRSGRYPASLSAASTREAIDGWGLPINYHLLPKRGFMLASPGPDGQPKTGDDLLWDRGRLVRGVPRRP